MPVDLIANPVLGEGTHFFGATLGNIRTGHAAQIILTPEAAPAPRAAQRIKSGYITITKLPVVIPGTHFSCAIDRIANPVSGEPQVVLIQSWLVALAQQIDSNRAV